jgi:hypothetical protein
MVEVEVDHDAMDALMEVDGGAAPPRGRGLTASPAGPALRGWPLMQASDTLEPAATGIDEIGICLPRVGGKVQPWDRGSGADAPRPSSAASSETAADGLHR